MMTSKNPSSPMALIESAVSLQKFSRKPGRIAGSLWPGSSPDLARTRAPWRSHTTFASRRGSSRSAFGLLRNCSTNWPIFGRPGEKQYLFHFSGKMHRRLGKNKYTYFQQNKHVRKVIKKERKILGKRDVFSTFFSSKNINQTTKPQLQFSF